MMGRKISAASFLILLFLPPKSCLPLEWPRPAVPRFIPLSGSKWGPWLSPWGWEDQPSTPPASPADELLPSQKPLHSCKPTGSTASLPQQQRAGRSSPSSQRRSSASSKRRDGRPNSLDLTFHLLREFLEMSREERLAQKARSNKILLHNIGK